VVATHPSSAGLVEAVFAAGATVVVLDGEAMRVPELVDAAAGAGCAGVLVGTSRKRFLGLLGGGGGAEPLPVADRAEASLATAAAAMVAGAGMVRVHDVAATVQVARLYGPAA